MAGGRTGTLQNRKKLPEGRVLKCTLQDTKMRVGFYPSLQNAE